MAKVRTLGMYNSGRNQLTSDLLDTLAKGNVREKNAAQYGQALQAMEASKYDEARKALQPLLAADPNNPWYLDLSTDIDLGQKKTADAINRLKGAKDVRTNPVLQLNLANAYLQGGQPGEAATILNRYTFNNKDDQNGWDLLAQAEAQLGNRDQELAARAEGFPWWAASIRRFPRSAAPARRSNSAASSRPVTTRVSISCAACSSALSRTRRCNKGEFTS